ncbi:MAG TPA: hypothetical protein VFF04_05460 [Candidatus Babeliales bacterium]|nr:hypothetical protein [Candidatus Babeliales bacterium]
MREHLIFMITSFLSCIIHSAQMTPYWSGGRWPDYHSATFQEQFKRLDEWDKDYYRRHQREIVKAMKWNYYEREERGVREAQNLRYKVYPKEQTVQPMNEPGARRLTGAEVAEIRERLAREEGYAACCGLCCVFVVAPALGIAAEMIKMKMKQD